MASKTQIVNLALLRIGFGKQVANVDTERSLEAVSARLAFEDERDFTLRDFAWPWATKYGTGELVTGSSTTPANRDWVYAYRYPSDCLMVRRVVTSAGRSEVNPPAFSVGRDDQGRLIYTSQEQAEFEYTSRVTNPEEFDSLFVSMLAWKLASVLAPPLSRIADMAQTAMKMYEVEKSKAQSRALNEGQEQKPAEAEWIRNR